MTVVTQASLKGAKLASTATSDPVATASLSWRGTVYPAYRDNVLERVNAASQARAALDACMDADDAVDARVACYDALIHAYRHLVIVIHKELQSATRMALSCVVCVITMPGTVTDDGGVSAEEIATRLGALSTAARGLLGEASIARGLLLAGSLEGRWRVGQERALLGGRGKARRDAHAVDHVLTIVFTNVPQSKDKGVRPEELVQQYDALTGLAHDMGELAGEVGGADAEHLMDESAAAEARFSASRALFLGVAALAGGRADEAVVLLELAGERGRDALAKTQVCRTNSIATYRSQIVVTFLHCDNPSRRAPLWTLPPWTRCSSFWIHPPRCAVPPMPTAAPGSWLTRRGWLPGCRASRWSPGPPQLRRVDPGGSTAFWSTTWTSA